MLFGGSQILAYIKEISKLRDSNVSKKEDIVVTIYNWEIQKLLTYLQTTVIGGLGILGIVLASILSGHLKLEKLWDSIVYTFTGSTVLLLILNVRYIVVRIREVKTEFLRKIYYVTERRTS